MITNEELINQIRESKKKRKTELRRIWDSLTKFESEKDVPELPITSQKEWEDYYIPKLIESGAVPKKDLKHGEYYIGSHPKTNIARWNSLSSKFEFWNQNEPPTISECNHFEDDDGHILFVPIKKGKKEQFDKHSYNSWKLNDTSST